MTMVMETQNVSYEKIRQLIIWLGLTELAWVTYWLLSNDQSTPQYIGIIAFWFVSMMVWLGAVIGWGKRGIFLNWTRYFSNMVGLSSILTFTLLLFCLVPVAREGLILAAGNTPDIQLISIHILRLLGIGAVIKYVQGELPLHFIILGSLPDLLFAVSAVIVAFMATNGMVGHGFLVIWHLVGFSAFLGAGISMFFSVPSILHIFNKKPDASIVFQYPMLLAPNFTVPLFIIAHAFALVKLFTA